MLIISLGEIYLFSRFFFSTSEIQVTKLGLVCSRLLAIPGVVSSLTLVISLLMLSICLKAIIYKEAEHDFINWTLQNGFFH